MPKKVTIRIWNQNCLRAGRLAGEDAATGDTTEYRDTPKRLREQAANYDLAADTCGTTDNLYYMRVADSIREGLDALGL